MRCGSTSGQGDGFGGGRDSAGPRLVSVGAAPGIRRGLAWATGGVRRGLALLSPRLRIAVAAGGGGGEVLRPRLEEACRYGDMARIQSEAAAVARRRRQPGGVQPRRQVVGHHTVQVVEAQEAAKAQGGAPQAEETTKGAAGSTADVAVRAEKERTKATALRRRNRGTCGPSR
ncbi:hypothetical protein U9M48_044363 [Paspalum notatum var. saurae]|uniref:Uncharacterized protein n=1 Tax=Paspalum notatum var. saurae TaxID=547442 RepID=A0AAQ3UUW7_PASNO